MTAHANRAKGAGMNQRSNRRSHGDRRSIREHIVGAWAAGPAIAIGASLLLTGCSTTGSMADLTGAHPAAPVEAFSYKPTSNGHVRVEVDEVTLHTDKDFLPTDPNWVQIRVRITNVGSRAINLTSGGEQLANGTVVNSAQSGAEVVKPPTIGKMLLMQSGGLAAAFLFPPALLVGVAADVAMPLVNAGRLEHIAEKFNQEALRVGPIAPGTSVSGLIFVPAVAGQTGLVLFYQDGGSTESIAIPRSQS